MSDGKEIGVSTTAELHAALHEMYMRGYRDGGLDAARTLFKTIAGLKEEGASEHVALQAAVAAMRSSADEGMQ